MIIKIQEKTINNEIYHRTLLIEYGGFFYLFILFMKIAIESEKHHMGVN